MCQFRQAQRPEVRWKFLSCPFSPLDTTSWSTLPAGSLTKDTEVTISGKMLTSSLSRPEGPGKCCGTGEVPGLQGWSGRPRCGFSEPESGCPSHDPRPSRGPPTPLWIPNAPRAWATGQVGSPVAGDRARGHLWPRDPAWQFPTLSADPMPARASSTAGAGLRVPV